MIEFSPKKSEVERGKNTYNETKALVLFVILEAHKQKIFLTSDEIADMYNLTHANASMVLTRLYDYGYIYRRNVRKKNLLYRNVKPKGERCARDYYARIMLRQEIGVDCIHLNLQKQLPTKPINYNTQEYNKIQTKYKEEFNSWLHDGNPESQLPFTCITQE